MDDATRRYYDAHAAEIASRYDSVASPVERYFAQAFPQGSRVLDVGAGSGRDVAALVRAGFDGVGVEPSDGLRASALDTYPELQGRLIAGALPALDAPFGGGFDGILCSAVLMHVPDGDLFDAAYAFRRLLKVHGRLLLSLPLTRGDVDADERDSHGRLFKAYPAEYLQLLFERIGFQLIGRWDSGDALGRPGTSWYTLLFELRAQGVLRAVDQIEGILNRDRKVATYKLALFRALAEMATQEPRVATWHPDGQVGVPIGRIAERWLQYYWPIFAESRLVPQLQAEAEGSRSRVAFRAPLRELMAEFAGQGEHGGLSAWQIAWGSGRLSSSQRDKLQRTLRSIASTIRSGPVTHSGGALETGPVFAYDAATRQVRMSAELWRELSLLGHWIVDAVIVRWAALTERFAHLQNIRSGDVLPLLLAKPLPERVTTIARKAYEARGVQRCAWSDRPLTRRFAVDHVIPWSLWGSNDLWNLLPVDSAINTQKSDKLPSADLLLDRRPAVIDNWRLLRDEMPDAFNHQAMHLLGRRIGGPVTWEDELFGRLREAVELTALQRGVERWSPR